MKICKVKGCNCKVYARGYCNRHYKQIMKYDKIIRTTHDPNEIVIYDDYAEIVLYDKNCEEVARASIDIDDVSKVKEYKWHLDSNGYVMSNKQIRLHRLIMNPSDDKVVDHIDHNRLNNKSSNLRVCSKHQNNMNTSLSRNSTSGVIGVHFNKQRNKWQAHITFNYKYIHLGLFDTLEEAIEARKQAEIEYFGEYRNQDEEDVS